MDVTKRFQEKIIFLFLIVFPFGQLLRFDVHLLGRDIPFLAIDVVVGLVALFALVNKSKYPKIWKYSVSFLTVLFFSYLLSLVTFKNNLIYADGLYLLRLASYFLFVVFVFNYARTKKVKEKLFLSLAGVSLFSAAFGWIQYFFWPDFRPFVIYGWDDHLYRMVGTFLDPGFTSIIFVFGALVSIILFLRENKKRYFLSFCFLIVSLAFTYARAGYLALLAGLFVIAALKRKVKGYLIFVVLFFLLILLLPRPASEGANLERTASVNARFTNYTQILEIFKKNPLFGVGYNNICLAREKYLNDANVLSHSCYGSDSSILLILATSGLIGFSVFIHLIKRILDDSDDGIYKTTLVSSGAALFIHSLFVNSLFYPFVLGWMAILIGLSLKAGSER